MGELRHLLKTENKVDLEDEIFEVMDCDGSHTLSIGVWAVGLAHLFEGSPEQKAEALFDLLDQDQDGSLSQEEIKEYVTPYVKAMIPREALPLRPQLLQHCVEQIMDSMDPFGASLRKMSHQKFTEWLCKNDVVDFLAKMIDDEVYRIFLNSNGCIA